MLSLWVDGSSRLWASGSFFVLAAAFVGILLLLILRDGGG